jgi:hypothetical protein
MRWLAQIVEGLLRAIFGHAQEQAERPDTITEVHTPKEVADKNTEAFKAWKKRKGIK